LNRSFNNLILELALEIGVNRCSSDCFAAVKLTELNSVMRVSVLAFGGLQAAVASPHDEITLVLDGTLYTFAFPTVWSLVISFSGFRNQN
jgi:hypothetical protein